MIGRPIRRREDPRLLRGGARFVDDIRRPGMLHAAFVRSPHAHARILDVDVAGAMALDGVELVLTADDTRHLGPMRGHLWVSVPPSLHAWLRPELRPDRWELLAVDRVRHVGEAVAVVAARDRALLEDALERVGVRYEALAPVLEPERALAAGAPRLDPDWPDNASVRLGGRVGDPETAFREAAVRARARARLRRQTGTPIETRGMVADFDVSTGRLAIWSNTQIPHALREAVSTMLELPEHRVRVVAVDSGGGFGIKGILYPEEVVVPLLAVRAGRPVKWIEGRMEHLAAAIHSRDQTHDIELCADAGGRLLGVRDRFVVDTGAYNPLRLTPALNTVAHLVGPYRVPSLEVEATVVVTNKAPNAPYRGAGRPEAVWAMERAMDRLARAMRIDPVELRLRNTLTEAEMPWDTGLLYRDGQPLVYDSGNHRGCLERALELVDWAGFRTAQAAARADGRYVGLGVAAYVEGTGVGPFEGASVRVDSTGSVVVHTGACSQGQGHETVFAQICATALGARYEEVAVVAGDTEGIPYGWGTMASRSTVVAGSAIAGAARIVRGQALGAAADLLEVAPDDLDIEAGVISVRGAPHRRLTLREVAERCAPQHALARGREPGLEGRCYFSPETVTYANGVHAVTVAVDVETGQVEILRYVVVHDCGRVVNPLLADGQVHGGVAQGIGAALLEEIVYGEDGALLTASFVDYLVPTAAEVPSLVVDHLESPSPRNPLGVKGLGEGGTIPVAAAVANAVEDALQPFDVVIEEAPVTPDRLLALLAGRGRPGAPRVKPD